MTNIRQLHIHTQNDDPERTSDNHLAQQKRLSFLHLPTLLMASLICTGLLLDESPIAMQQFTHVLPFPYLVKTTDNFMINQRMGMPGLLPAAGLFKWHH